MLKNMHEGADGKSTDFLKCQIKRKVCSILQLIGVINEIMRMLILNSSLSDIIAFYQSNNSRLFNVYL